MNILIASVYNYESLKWIEIQSDFIEKNTASKFDHIIFYNKTLGSVFKDDLLKTKKNIVFDHSEKLSGQEQHVFGIKKILQLFNSSDSYSHCLIIDSDAFPIRKRWDIHIEASMKSNSCLAACPIRFENLDTFFHPCVIFFDRNANIDVSLNLTSNLLQNQFEEVTVNPNCKTFPLLKTNFLNFHPIAASIYFDMFYHHGFGSRNFFCRSIHLNRYHSYNYFLDKITNELMSNPSLFINKLRGKRLMHA